DVVLGGAALLAPSLDLVHEAHMDLSPLCSRPSARAAARRALEPPWGAANEVSVGAPMSADDAQERLVARELGKVQFLPDARRRVAKARACESRTRLVVIRIARQLFLAAKTRKPIDQQHAVDVERLVEADQARLVARRIGALDAEESGQVDDTVQMTAQVGDAEEPAVAVRHRDHRRQREDLARLAQR